ncbi:MAG: hypothetical protein ACI9J4_000567 [Paraglaciecola sp.]|jgi:hypothetical protein
MNWTVSGNELQHVIIHSAVLAKGNKVILFLTPLGLDKSTLTAYLAHDGWRLFPDGKFSDIAIDTHKDDVIHLFPPVKLAK